MASRATLFAAALAATAAIGSAEAGTPALVVDAGSGRVLYADRATEPWYPASITKLMTTYVALDQVRSGKWSMNSLLTLSPRAAAEPPSKMGFKPGTQITLENALKIIMVKSANDIAMMIGENLGGSVDGFAELMNGAAQRLGMHESRWVNPNGLPDERQQTSARDMAILARALLRDFPEHDSLFHIGALKLGRQIIRNHNGMLGRYPGADGMKTGFICMGGFNIVASATQNGRRLIAVVMGYPSARDRDLRAADLFDHGFRTLGWSGQQVSELPPSGIMSPPNMRDVVCGPNRRQPENDDETAIVAQGPSGANADNPIAALFAPQTYSAASAGSTPMSSGRKTLGPRVAFEPEPIWIGPSPGAAPDAAETGGPAKIAIAAKPVRTKPLARNAAIGATLPASAQAFAPTAAAGGADVEMVKPTARPGGRKALRENLEPTPTAEIKPKLGAIGSGGETRERLGGIPLKPTLASGAGKDEAERPKQAAPVAAVPAKLAPAGAAPKKPTKKKVAAKKPVAAESAGASAR